MGHTIAVKLVWSRVRCGIISVYMVHVSNTHLANKGNLYSRDTVMAIKLGFHVTKFVASHTKTNKQKKLKLKYNNKVQGSFQTI